MKAIDAGYDEKGDFELADELEKLSGVKIPAAVEEIRIAPILHDKQCEVDGMKDVVKEFLQL